MNWFQSVFHKVADWISAKDQNESVDQRLINRSGYIPLKDHGLGTSKENKWNQQKNQEDVGVQEKTEESRRNAQEGQYSQNAEQSGRESGYPSAAYSSDNLVQFPGSVQTQTSMYEAPPFVEYVVMLKARKDCKEVIEYIKENASVFVNMEFIAGEKERQSCVDVLSGAAYTLGCQMNRISPRGMYLISSPGVKVILDHSIQKIATQQEGQFASQMLDGFKRVQPGQMLDELHSKAGYSGNTGTYAAQNPAVKEVYSSQEQGNDYGSQRMRGRTPTERFQSAAFQRPEESGFAPNSYRERWAQVQ